MCANVRATRHCSDEGNDLMSMNVVSFLLMEEVDEIIPEVKRALGSDYIGSYEEEIIFEGSKVDTSRIIQRPFRPDEMPASCMPLHIEISIDGDSKAYINDELVNDEQAI